MINRIKMLVQHYQLSARAFAHKCGLKDNTFINQMNGVREVSLTTICGILLSNEEISAEWLIRGKGEMLLNSQQRSENGERVNKLIDTLAFLQTTVSEQREHIRRIEEKNRQLTSELASLTNDRSTK